MKVAKKHFGLILASLIAMSFNSHFAQAARKTGEMISTSRVYAFKRVGEVYEALEQIEANPLVIKKTAVQVDRKNLYIGGYIINTSGRVVPHVRVYPSFMGSVRNKNRLVEVLTHDERNLKPGEVRRFVIVRPVTRVRELMESNLPVEENCILNVREL